jgi:hypothetical protein
MYPYMIAYDTVYVYVCGDQTFQNVESPSFCKPTIRFTISSTKVFLTFLSNAHSFVSCSCLIVLRSFIPLFHVHLLVSGVLFGIRLATLNLLGLLQICPLRIAGMVCHINFWAVAAANSHSLGSSSLALGNAIQPSVYRIGPPMTRYCPH